MADESNNMPPVPSEIPISDRDTGKMKFGVTWTRWFIQLKAKIDVINTSIANLAKFTGTGFITKDSAGAWVGRTITGTANDITVTNGDGSAGNPTISSGVTGVTAGTYGDGTHVPQVTVRADGKITAIENVDITGGGGGGIALKGRVDTYADLPSTGNTSGDAWLVDLDQEIYVWNGTAFPADGDGINIVATTYASVVPGAANFSTVGGTGLILASQISVVELDDGGLWDAVNKRFIIKQSGVYSIVAQFRTTTSATLNPYIKVNGRYVSVSPSPPSFDHSTLASLRLAVGDAVELWFYHVGSVGVVGTADPDFGQAQRFSLLGLL